MSKPETMHAGWYERMGAAHDVITFGEMERPQPRENEVLVRLHASGIDPSDYKRRANTRAKMEFPRIIPHSDGAGIVAAVGPGVRDLREGDRVWVFHAQWQRPFGTAAEYVALPRTLVRPLPQGLSFAQGACLGIPAMTGYRAVHVAGAPCGKTIYVAGATGRVGAYAVQFAKRGGARVIASTGSGEDARREIARLGADVVLDRKAPDLAARILAETGGEGVDQIVEVDISGNIALDESILREGGAIVSFGAATAPSVPIAQGGRRARNMSLHFILVYMLSPAVIDATCNGINEAADGLVHRIGGTFALEKLAEAHAFAETTSGSGHVIVTM
ncbi:MAG TPA: NADPH:quinone reductase [Xanthobacteraceae bacterium]|nr:NADPH:quinone reductase [Xanthobacteraceae bacterium]